MKTPNEPIAYLYAPTAKRPEGQTQVRLGRLREIDPDLWTETLLYAAPVTGETPTSDAANECLMAVEYAANHIEWSDERADFIVDVAQHDLPELLRMWPPYASWRAERMGAKS